MRNVTKFLVYANILVFAVEMVFGDAVIAHFALWPLRYGFAWWQLITSAFLHADLMHLFVNMFGLWMFGRDVERVLGARRFVQLYFLSALTASFAQLLVTALLRQTEPTLGASGAVFGMLGAFALLFPNRVIVLLFPPIPMPARVFVFCYAVVELTAGVLGTQAGVAHFAHLGGLAGGLWLMWRWRRHAF